MVRLQIKHLSVQSGFWSWLTTSLAGRMTETHRKWPHRLAGWLKHRTGSDAFSWQGFSSQTYGTETHSSGPLATCHLGRRARSALRYAARPLRWPADQLVDGGEKGSGSWQPIRWACAYGSALSQSMRKQWDRPANPTGHSNWRGEKEAQKHPKIVSNDWPIKTLFLTHLKSLLTLRTKRVLDAVMIHHSWCSFTVSTKGLSAYAACIRWREHSFLFFCLFLEADGLHGIYSQWAA